MVSLSFLRRLAVDARRRKARDSVSALVEEAVDAGAEAAHRTDAPSGHDGWFYPQTAAHRYGTGRSDPAAGEIFGPVSSVVTWPSQHELLRWVNATEFGLAACVNSGSLQRAIRLGSGRRRHGS